MKKVILTSRIELCHGTTPATIELDGLISSGRVKQNDIIAQVNQSTLGGDEVFVVDTRVHAAYGRDPIWDIPLEEWEEGTSWNHQRRMLLQVKTFLQVKYGHVQAQRQNREAQENIRPFSIVIIGYKSCFSDSLDSVVMKLQRDASWLHRNASVSFLDLGSAEGDHEFLGAPEQQIAAAINILISSNANNQAVASLNTSKVLNARAHQARAGAAAEKTPNQNYAVLAIQPPLNSRKVRVKVALSFDFDALAGLLGTGDNTMNSMQDYSTGIFAGRVGSRRLLRMLLKYGLADKVTWFVPAHSMETFESAVKEIIQAGCEIGLHGYAHEGALQMTPTQERDVLTKCMEVARRLTGKNPLGYRAPLYQLRETTVELLKEFGFLFDSSLSHHDCQPYFTPSDPPIKRIDFSQPASTWMHPTPLAPVNHIVGHPLVEIPSAWHNEDMFSLQFLPHVANSNGFVDARVVEQRWKNQFLWSWENSDGDSEDGSFIYPLVMHPDSSGIAHVILMVDRFIGWLRNWGESVHFFTHGDIARDFLKMKGVSVGGI